MATYKLTQDENDEDVLEITETVVKRIHIPSLLKKKAENEALLAEYDKLKE